MSDRHPKWQRVEPGTVIPAGQPYRVEYPTNESGDQALEQLWPDPLTVPNGNEWFVDSSWRPPLVLPTEPTWGIVRTEAGYPTVAEWYCLDETKRNLIERTGMWQVNLPILDFIPLTEEQVQRIEAAR